MTSKSFRFPVLTLAILALAMSAAAPMHVNASSERSISLEEHVHGSKNIVVGKARVVSPVWQSNDFGDRIIVSRVLLDVEETLKGAAGQSMWFDVDGGTLDGVTLRVSDVPEVHAGDRGVFMFDGGDSSVQMPHVSGQGVLMLGEDDVVRGTSIRLDDIRRVARVAGK